MSKRLTAIIQAEPPGFVALCPELDVASQGDTVELALANLEAVELFYECVRRPKSPLGKAVTSTSLSLRFLLGKLRVLSGREVCDILERHGFVEVRRRGSHIIMQRVDDGSTTTVPVPDHK